MSNNIDVQKCLNGYLLIIGVHKIIITDDSFSALKSCVLECDGETEIEEPEIKKKKITSKKWALKFDQCVECGTTEIPHRVKGRCKKCYSTWLSGTKRKNINPVSSAGKKYHCEECENEFFSVLDYMDVRCECGSKRLLTLK